MMSVHGSRSVTISYKYYNLSGVNPLGKYTYLSKQGVFSGWHGFCCVSKQVMMRWMGYARSPIMGHNMLKLKTVAIGLLAGLFAATTAQAAVVVTFEGEAPGIQNTTATFNAVAIQTFDTLPTNAHTAAFSQTTVTGTGTITMSYSGGTNGIRINSADQYGGAGGIGKYAVAFNSTPYTLDVSSTNITGGVNYFGYWLSALDAGNEVLFYGNSGQLLLTFHASDLINYLATLKNTSAYYGNPNVLFKGNDSSEPFVFLNFFDTDSSFSKIVFQELPTYGGGYESDNHTVGNYRTMGTGSVIPLIASVAVPEPASWAMMIVGLGSIGLAMRSRRRGAVVFA